MVMVLNLVKNRLLSLYENFLEIFIEINAVFAEENLKIPPKIHRLGKRMLISCFLLFHSKHVYAVVAKEILCVSHSEARAAIFEDGSWINKKTQTLERTLCSCFLLSFFDHAGENLNTSLFIDQLRKNKLFRGR